MPNIRLTGHSTVLNALLCRLLSKLGGPKTRSTITYCESEQNGLSPSSPASKETLIRRLAFDLTGLPPSLSEIDRFLADQSDDAYQRLVEHYLASPAYGENLASVWLDLARYADTNGYQYDTERKHWVWRDWVIHAYNQNNPSMTSPKNRSPEISSQTPHLNKYCLQGSTEIMESQSKEELSVRNIGRSMSWTVSSLPVACGWA